MSAVADFYIDCVDHDCVPLSDDTRAYLRRMSDKYQTCHYDESCFDFTSRFGETRTIEGITIDSARRLCRLHFAVTEIKDFIDLVDECSWTRL